jgi:hypothetical protein
MNLTTFIYAGGALTLLLALFHALFPRVFKWHTELPKLGPVNRRIFFTIHLALLLLFIALGAVSIAYAPELAACRGVSFGLVLALALFWLWRAAWQIVYFRGGWLHYAMIAWFLLLCACYAVPLASSR